MPIIDYFKVKKPKKIYHIKCLVCPICKNKGKKEPLHFRFLIFRQWGCNMQVAESNYSYDRRCDKCKRVFKSRIYRNGGKYSTLRMINDSRPLDNKTGFTSYYGRGANVDYDYCEIQRIDEYLKLTPYKKRVHDLPNDPAIKIPEDFHNEFVEYRKKLEEEKW